MDGLFQSQIVEFFACFSVIDPKCTWVFIFVEMGYVVTVLLSRQYIQDVEFAKI